MSSNLEIPYDLATIYGICNGSVTDELLEIYAEICNSFTNIAYSGHVTELDYIENLLISQNISTPSAADAVFEVIMTAVEECLHVIGVSINPETPIAHVPVIMSSLLEFDPTDTPEFVAAIVEDSEGPIECICDLMEYFSTIDSDTWLGIITGVKDTTISAIKHQINLEVNKQNTLNSDVPTIIADMRTKAQALKEVFEDVSLIDISTESSSLEDLYGLHIASIVDMDQDKAIREILGLAMISNESNSTLDGAIGLVLDDLFYDPADRIKVNSKVNNYKSKISHLLANR